MSGIRDALTKIRRQPCRPSEHDYHGSRCASCIASDALDDEDAERPPRTTFPAAELAMAQAVIDAREYVGKLGEHEARYAVLYYLRECKRRGVDPMELLGATWADPAFLAECVADCA